MLPLMKRTLTLSLDLDWLYRRMLPATWRWFAGALDTIRDKAVKDLAAARRSLGDWFGTHWGSTGLFARSWPISTTALWIAALLAAYALVYYI